MHPMKSSAYSIARRPRRRALLVADVEAEAFFTRDHARIARFLSKYTS
jgi:hypothetical protein